jgi:hypothetical protein
VNIRTPAQRREDAVKLEALRAQIHAGVEALERGEYTQVPIAEVERYLETLTVVAGDSKR